mmetsp:Transcript_39369/g.60185  ORF Transcript_39369/g.60185 Transcript_39369/m.60185 type:complete len:103 (-) Transcript_39369:639-947(-)
MNTEKMRNGTDLMGVMGDRNGIGTEALVTKERDSLPVSPKAIHNEEIPEASRNIEESNPKSTINHNDVVPWSKHNSQSKVSKMSIDMAHNSQSAVNQGSIAS